MLFFLRRRVESRYRWFERRFLEGFASGDGEQKRTKQLSKMLAPWNVTLQEIQVPVGSSLGAKTLEELQLRERYGINVVCIERGEELIVTPFPSERLLPMDVLLIFGDDIDVAKFRVKKCPLNISQILRKMGILYPLSDECDCSDVASPIGWSIDSRVTIT